MPRIWGEDFEAMMPPMQDIDAVNRILSLIARLLHSIISNLEDPDGARIVPLGSTRTHLHLPSTLPRRLVG